MSVIDKLMVVTSAILTLKDQLWKLLTPIKANANLLER
ncbi:uncharacterized protein METZ01_LOCUS274032, partial [marine metagenome]